MNWYRSILAQQMNLYPEDQSQYIPTPEGNSVNQFGPEYLQYEQEIGEWTLEDALEIAKTPDDVVSILTAQGLNYDTVEFADGTSFIIVGNSEYIIDMSRPGDYEAEETLSWLYGLSDWDMESKLGIEDLDNSAEFWNGVSDQGYYLYHGTREEYIDSIMAEGLQPRDETRGISNRNMGAAVFMSPDPTTAEYYYDIVLQIDVSAMKRDGYMPQAGEEEPLEEGELRSSIAHSLGIEDFHDESSGSDGLDPGTVVFYDAVPPKYLSVYG